MDAPNPILITVINMVIVFAVLYVLGLLIKFIHYIDPTKSKSKKPVKVGKVITKKHSRALRGAISGGCYSGKNTDSSYNYIFNGLRLP